MNTEKIRFQFGFVCVLNILIFFICSLFLLFFRFSFCISFLIIIRWYAVCFIVVVWNMSFVDCQCSSPFRFVFINTFLADTDNGQAMKNQPNLFKNIEMIIIIMIISIWSIGVEVFVFNRLSFMLIVKPFWNVITSNKS